MHLVHLAIIPDMLVSLLLDLSDGPRRDETLADLWESYKDWCDSQGASQRDVYSKNRHRKSTTV